jgi:hypothetical protein
MAREITYQTAINEALAQEMERDPTVVVFGESRMKKIQPPIDVAAQASWIRRSSPVDRASTSDRRNDRESFAPTIDALRSPELAMVSTN